VPSDRPSEGLSQLGGDAVVCFSVPLLLGNEGIGIRFTDKPVTPWGGLVLFSTGKEVPIAGKI
jgi:hypothetical protein